MDDTVQAIADYGLAIVGIEAFCIRVLAQEREGAPAVPVGRRPPRPHVDFALEPMLPVGKPTILFGSEGTGKSTLAAAIAVSVASGVRAFSRWHVPAPQGVLILDWEADEDDWNDLLAAIAKGIGIEPPDRIFYAPCARPLTDDINRVARLIQQHQAGLIVVDSVGLASPSSGQGADANEGATRFFRALRVLGATSLLIDHVPKSDEAKGRPYGSVYKPAMARMTYELRASDLVDDDGARHLALFHQKQNNTAKQKPVGIRVIRTDDEVLLESEVVDLSDERLARGATLVDRLRDALRSGSRTIKELEELTETSDAVLRRVLNRHDELFVAVSVPGEKAKSWGLRASSVTPVTVSRDSVTHGMRDSGLPLRGESPPVSRNIPAPSQTRAFDGLKQANEGRLA